jgi:hypothetical protein
MTKEEKLADFCQFNKCKSLSDIIYLGAGLCNLHWSKIAELSSVEICKKLKIKKPEDEEEKKEKV